MSTDEHKRPMTSDEQRLAFEYIKQNPNLTVEDIVNYFSGHGYGWDYSYRIIWGEAVEFLVQNEYCTRDDVTQAISIKNTIKGGQNKND